MTESFFIRTEGGPHPGTRIVGEDQFPWPLPGTLNDQGGKYLKVSESSLPPQPDGSHVVRSAHYVWRTTEQIMEAVNATAQD